MRQRREGGDESEPIASLALTHAFHEALRLRVGISRRVRAPSLVQLHDSTNGNPDLAMERATTAEVGLDARHAFGRVQATLFQSRVRDLIQTDDATGRAANRERARFTGLEIAAPLEPAAGWRLTPAWTTLRAVDRSDGALFERLSYRPRNKWSLDARWQATPSLQLAAALLHVRGQVYESRSGTPQQAELDAYTLLDFSARWQLGAWQLAAGVDNALDKDYATSYGFPLAGRSAWLRGTVSF